MSRITAFVLLVLFVPIPAFPWGNEGHELVARIAARHLTPAARKGIVKLLRATKSDDLRLKAVVGKSGAQPDDDAVEDVLATIATWPDHMPNGKQETAPWHFIDIGLFEGPSHIGERCGEGCVNQKIREILDSMPRGKKVGRFTPDRQLRFLVHFMGDIHQPLHAVTNADAGGNCEAVTGFGSLNKLHSVWDTALVRAVIADADDIEAEIIQEFRVQKDAFQALTDPDKIAAESFELAKTKVYNTAKPPIPVINRFIEVRPSQCNDANITPEGIRKAVVDGAASYDNDESRLVVRRQLYKGGVRLAKALNDTFK